MKIVKVKSNDTINKLPKINSCFLPSTLNSLLFPQSLFNLHPAKFRYHFPATKNVGRVYIAHLKIPGQIKYYFLLKYFKIQAYYGQKAILPPILTEPFLIRISPTIALSNEDFPRDK